MAPLEKTQFEKDLEELILKTPAPGKHSARNAIRHIECAWALVELDPEMAAFRAITAEEESATAVFHAIRRRKYIGSEKLKPHDHVQKNALFPFFAAIAELLEHADTQLELRPQILLDKKQKNPKLQIRFSVNKIIPGKQFAIPQPPLHFSITQNNALHDFSNQLDNIAKSKQAASILKHLKERANKRNQLLYASTAGIPRVTALNNFLSSQRTHVNINLGVYLFIDPYREKQLFVQQGLLAFLKMLNQLPKGIIFQ